MAARGASAPIDEGLRLADKAGHTRGSVDKPVSYTQ